MNWRQLDLNLLVVFDAVMRERNATRAAEKLNMSQPAVSHALARLRAALGDELFVRTPEGMEPTPQAEHLAPSVRQALADLSAALGSKAIFEPRTATRDFVMAANNYAALVIATPLAAAVAREAPLVTLDIRASGTLDIAERLDRGDLDLALGGMAAPGDRFRDIRLFEDRFACLLRRGHPAIKAAGKIDARLLAELPHLDVSSTGQGTGFIDEELARLGLERQIVLRAPLLATAGMLAQSDVVTIMAERAARAFAANASLQVMALPLPSPTLTMAMLWHRRMDDQPAHRWLRGVIRGVCRAL
jgi:DNA-binding transcriptional LysR family regulator